LTGKEKTMGGVYEVYIETHFSAAHALKGYPGDCARLHGHNWIIRVYVKCLELDEIGIGIDFRLIKENVKAVLSGLDHFNINELPPFHDVNPSSENIAKYLYQTLSERINTEKIKVSRIRVSETPNAGAYYWEE
jgi:6-pyruvoyltetrahydropterin/6-carboxytetrahydropterin synthase